MNGKGRYISAVQLRSVTPTDPTLSDLMGANDRRHFILRAPPFGNVRSKRDTDTL